MVTLVEKVPLMVLVQDMGYHTRCAAPQPCMKMLLILQEMAHPHAHSTLPEPATSGPYKQEKANERHHMQRCMTYQAQIYHRQQCTSAWHAF